jgi:isopenicillin-N N-acyltransferase like protein
MKRAALVSALLVVTLLAGCSSSAKPSREQAQTPFPAPIVDLRGSGADIGAQHAVSLGQTIQVLHENYLRVFLQNESRRFAAMTLAALFEARLRPEHRQEVRALAEHLNMDPREVMLAQCFLDLTPIAACSTVTLPGSASPDGVARFGRNLDFPSLNIADKHSVVLIYHPAGKNAFAAVGWPGMIGVLTGMNEHGLTLANMEVRRGARFPSAMPYTLLYRTILEDCATVEEAIELLENSPRQTSNTLMLMDASGGRAVVELTPESVFVRRGEQDQALISTNDHRGEDTTSTGQCRRYDTLRAMSQQGFGRINVSRIETMLERVAQGERTMQSMVFEPENRVMYLATGLNAPRETFHRLDLNEYFK